MHEIAHHINLLPHAIRSELVAHIGHTAGMAPLQLVAHHRAVAHKLIAQKRSRYEPLAPHGEMAILIADMLQGGDLGFVAGAPHEPFRAGPLTKSSLICKHSLTTWRPFKAGSNRRLIKGPLRRRNWLNFKQQKPLVKEHND
jgi:hypothetical protein